MLILIAVLLFIIVCAVAPDFMSGLFALAVGLAGLALVAGIGLAIHFNAGPGFALVFVACCGLDFYGLVNEV